MGRLAPNQALALEVIARLRAAGVSTFCLCPGGRNAPLVEALDAGAGRGLDVLDFFDERSAAFFALGRARRDLRPAVVVTTSGTASAELLPAMVEAYYSCTPLVALTADRPRTYRGTGAPQTIEQVGLFGTYARQQLDLDRAGTAWTFDPATGPSHLNVCFDEPLLDGWQETVADAAGDVETVAPSERDVPGASVPTAGRDAAGAGRLAAALDGCSQPLILLGALPLLDDRDDALAWCRQARMPVLAEAASGVRAALGEQLLRAGEVAARRGFEQGRFDSVVLLGDIPSWRLWRDFEATWRVPVASVSRTPWPGLTHGVHLRLRPGERLSSVLPGIAWPASVADGFADLLAFDRTIAALTECLLSEYPESEPALVRRVSNTIPDGSFVYLGNSLPIREWNQFEAIEPRSWRYGANRGANGIDGQISTFLGQAEPGRENWAVVGDLTALYDLQALWALRHAHDQVRVVVINNGGGRIFERMFVSPRFQNRHSLSLEPVAALWGMAYASQLPLAGERGPVLIEVRPSHEQTAAFLEALRAGAAR